MADNGMNQVNSTFVPTAPAATNHAAPVRRDTSEEIGHSSDDLLESSGISMGSNAGASAQAGAESGSSSSVGTHACKDKFDVETHVSEAPARQTRKTNSQEKGGDPKTKDSQPLQQQQQSSSEHAFARSSCSLMSLCPPVSADRRDPLKTQHFSLSGESELFDMTFNDLLDDPVCIDRVSPIDHDMHGFVVRTWLCAALRGRPCCP